MQVTFRLAAILLLTLVATSALAQCKPEAEKLGPWRFPQTHNSKIEFYACVSEHRHVDWTARNLTAHKLSTGIIKIYETRCGQRIEKKGSLLLKPNETLKGGPFSGDFSLSDFVDIDKDCDVGQPIRMVNIGVIDLKDLTEAELALQEEQQKKKELAEKKEEEESLAQERELHEKSAFEERERKEAERAGQEQAERARQEEAKAKQQAEEEARRDEERRRQEEARQRREESRRREAEALRKRQEAKREQQRRMRESYREAETAQVDRMASTGAAAAAAYESFDGDNTWKIQIQTGTGMMGVPVYTLVQMDTDSDGDPDTAGEWGNELSGGWIGAYVSFSWWPFWYKYWGLGIKAYYLLAAPMNVAMRFGGELNTYWGQREGWQLGFDLSKDWLLVGGRDESISAYGDQIYSNEEALISNWRTVLSGGYYFLRAAWVHDSFGGRAGANGFGVLFNGFEFAKIEFFGFPNYAVLGSEDGETGWHWQLALSYCFTFYGDDS